MGGEEGEPGWRGDWLAHNPRKDKADGQPLHTGAFAFTCSTAEAALLKEALQLVADLIGSHPERG